MKKSLKITVTVMIIVLLAGMIIYPKLKPVIVKAFSKKPGTEMQMRQGQQKLAASGFIIRPTVLSELVKQTGTLRPDEEVDLSFETSGKIVNINFKEGSRVRKGELLAKINDKPLQAQLEKLLAQQKLSEAKEFRQKSLLSRDAISQESYDQIQTELQTTQADINLVKARISETELRAPFDGTIGLRYLSEGAYATPSTKIAKLVKLSPLKIEYSISEKYTREVNIGYPVTFTIEGINEVFNASVYAIDPKLDLETRTIVLRALYPNSKEELKPGRFASVTMELSKVDDAIAIPTEALIPEMEGERVFVYRGGKASSVRVTTGLRTESKVQITDGLRYGDTLLITGILQLRQGLPIQLDTIITNQ